MSERPLLLDLFAGAGGSGAGYARAGFSVVGVDIDPRPLRHNPHECYVGDALAVLDTLLAGERWQGYRLSDFAVVHGSPPCQEYSTSRYFRLITGVVNRHDALIPHLRERLAEAGIAWVLENVVGAPMPGALMLCGTMFGLPIRRHRLFVSSHLLFAADVCHHGAGCYNVAGGKVRGYGAYATGMPYRSKDGHRRVRESYPPKSVGQAAMGINWMTVAEMSQAIPPVFTEWLGRQLMTVVLAASDRFREVA